jgi:hypothetical protein
MWDMCGQGGGWSIWGGGTNLVVDAMVCHGDVVQIAGHVEAELNTPHQAYLCNEGAVLQLVSCDAGWHQAA